MKNWHDIKGQLLEVRDPLDRVCFEHKYDTAGNNLWTKHLDSGEKTLAVDAQGKPLYSTDAKGAAVYTAYDDLHRPTDIWAKDASAESVTLRQHMLYGDSAGLTDPELLNLKGQLVTHYDEAGKATITGYDFKGNPLEKVRQVIADTELTGTEKYVVDWDGLAVPLDAKEYVTGLLYDGLNRVRKSILPEDVDMERKEMVPTYNRAGALEAITFDGTDYVRHIAYNAKGQRVLLAMGNGMMTRYAYDPIAFRLQRIKTERYVEEDHEYDPQSGSTKQDSAYEYDLGGNILKIKERVDDCGIDGTLLGVDALDRVFQYDPLKRLLQATGRESDTQGNSNHWEEKPAPGSPNAEHTRAYTQTFQYDKVGNILQLGHQADSNNYNRHYRYATGINHLEQLDNNGGTPTVYAGFTYDEAGNQLTINTDRFFEWDAADQLRYFKIDDGTTVSVQAHYLYAGGDRVKKLVRDQQGNVEVTVYIDGVYEHRYRKDSVGDVEEEQNILHIMDGRSRIATVRLGDPMDDPGPPVKYNLEDHLGTSTTRLTDDGTIIDREEYYPFGESSLRTFEKKRYRYVGKELDSESGLYYYGARYYAAWVGRFISVDPLAHDYPHLNPYNYAGNKPIGDIDIDGLQGSGEAASGGGDTAQMTDSTGKTVNIDPGAEIATTGIIDQGGDLYVDVNGVGFVKSSLLDANNIEYGNPSFAENNKTGYLYTPEDLAMRKLIFSYNDPSGRNVIATAVRTLESEGKFQPLTREGFIEKYGESSGFVVWAMFMGIAFETMPGTDIRLPQTKGFKLKPILPSKGRLPMGFKNQLELDRFGATLKKGLKEAGVNDADGLFQGSTVTGRKWDTGVPFDVGRASDFDVAIGSPSLFERAKSLGIGTRSKGIRTGQLTDKNLEDLGLTDLSQALKKQAGRTVNFMIYSSSSSASAHKASIPIP